MRTLKTFCGQTGLTIPASLAGEARQAFIKGAELIDMTALDVDQIYLQSRLDVIELGPMTGMSNIVARELVYLVRRVTDRFASFWRFDDQFVIFIC